MSVTARACVVKLQAVQYDGTNGKEIADRWPQEMLLSPVTDVNGVFTYNSIMWGPTVMTTGQWLIEQVNTDLSCSPWYSGLDSLDGFIMLDTVPQT